MTKKFDDDEIVQPLSPLHVHRIETSFQMITAMNLDQLWRDVREWVNLRQPHVLWQKDMLRMTCYIYFETSELYVEFVQKFPVFLRGFEE